MKKLLAITLTVILAALVLPVCACEGWISTDEPGVYYLSAESYVDVGGPEKLQWGMADNLNFVKNCFANFESVYSETHNQHFCNYTLDSLYSAEEILKNIFKTTEYALKKNSYDYTGEIETYTSEKEYTEGSLKIKLTEEKAVMLEIPDTYVSIERRYIWKDGEYQLSTVNVNAEIGEEGVYYDAVDDYDPRVLMHISTENPLCGYMQTIDYEGRLPNPVTFKNPVVTTKYSYVYGDSYTVLKNTTYVDPEIRFTNPECWNDVAMFDIEIKFSTVDAERSATGKAVEAGDYRNYQIVSIHREMTLVCPEVEEYKAPQTSLTTVTYAAVAALAIGVVVVKKRK